MSVQRAKEGSQFTFHPECTQCVHLSSQTSEGKLLTSISHLARQSHVCFHENFLFLICCLPSHLIWVEKISNLLLDHDILLCFVSDMPLRILRPGVWSFAHSRLRDKSFNPERCTAQLQLEGELTYACTFLARKAFRLALTVPGGVTLLIAGVTQPAGREIPWPQVSVCVRLGLYLPKLFFPCSQEARVNKARRYQPERWRSTQNLCRQGIFMCARTWQLCVIRMMVLDVVRHSRVILKRSSPP